MKKIMQVIVFAVLLPVAWLIARYGWEYLNPYYEMGSPSRKGK